MNKTSKAKQSPEEVVLRVEKMLTSPIFFSNKTNPHHEEFLQHTKEELRKLQACLPDIDLAERDQVTKWVHLHSTTKRLSNLENAIHALETAETKQTKPSVINQCVRNVNYGAQYNAGFTEFLNLEDLIKRRQELQNKINRIQQTKDALASTADIAGSLNTAVKTGKAAVAATALTAESASTLAHTGHAIGGLSPVLASIPIVGGIVNAAAATGGAIYSFAKKKGASDNIAKVITAGVAIAAVAFTIAFPVAALGIAAGTSAVTTVTNYIKPYIEIRKEIKAKEQELEVSKVRPAELDKPGTLLHDDEKAYLIRQLNDHYAKDDKISKESLHAAKDAVKSGKLDELEKNPHVREALGLSDKQAVKDKLIEHHTDNQTNLATKIAKLNTEKTTLGAMSIASTAATVGLVMMAIPFPPVIFAGAVVAAVATVAQFAIKYREQIGNFFKRVGKGIKNLFSSEKSDENLLENKLTNKNDIEATVIKTKTPVKNAPEVKAQEVKTSNNAHAEQDKNRIAVTTPEPDESLRRSQPGRR